MKKFIGIFIIPIVFLTIFSVYRNYNDKEPLSTRVFLSSLNQLDYDFENTQYFISSVNFEWQRTVNDWSEPLPSFNSDITDFFGLGSILQEFFARCGTFFGFLGTVIFTGFGFSFDFIELFVSIVKLLFGLLGFIPLESVNG